MNEPCSSMRLLRKVAGVRWFALCAGLSGLMYAPVQAQTLVRLTAGEGARIFSARTPQGEDLRLGVAARADQDLFGLAVQADAYPPTLCCQQASMRTGARCESERGIPLRARQRDVLERYGPPRSYVGLQMNYPGIRFTLDGGTSEITEICVMPR